MPPGVIRKAWLSYRRKKPTPSQRTINHLVTRMLDDLYWVMSYSRWKDERYFLAFRDGFTVQHPQFDAAGLNKVRNTNARAIIF